jgi:hypothetical protein
MVSSIDIHISYEHMIFWDRYNNDINPLIIKSIFFSLRELEMMNHIGIYSFMNIVEILFWRTIKI